MEGKTDLPSRRIKIEKQPDSVNLSRKCQTSSTFKSSSSDTSRAELIQSFQAACKRRRPAGMVQPRRNVIPQQEISKDSGVQPNSRVLDTNSKEDIPTDKILQRFVSTSRSAISIEAESRDVASTTPPSEWDSTVNTNEEKFMLYTDQRDQGLCIGQGMSNMVWPSGIESGKPLPQVAKKVQFSSENNASSQGAGDPLTTRIDDILSHLDSLALTEMEWDPSHQLDASHANIQNWRHHCDQSMEMDNGFKSESGISSLLAGKTAAAQDKPHPLENFLQNDLNNAMTQSSVAGLSGVTSTLINSASAPMIRSTPYRLQPQSRVSLSDTEPAGSGDAIKYVVAQDHIKQFENFLRNDMNNAMTQSSVVGSSCVTSTLLNSTSAPMISSTTYQPQTRDTLSEKERALEADAQVDVLQPSNLSLKYADGISFNRSVVTSQAISSTSDANISSVPSKELQSLLPRDPHIDRDSSVGNNTLDKGNATDIKSQKQVSLSASVDENVDKSKSEKIERGASGKAATASRKKGYDPDLFFKVNGKLYQRLGKIGSGGSSEVHKVISSDCKIYALKKIKLRGRDYATAYGFCQEIEYLNRLKGKNNIIQLIDFEVTDKTLLQEVMKGSMNNKDGRVKDDGHIYMVLEYGEIDLAHMLSHKWKELEGSNATIDENWLRFYWQQILLAVNTIHEERIVHSDLKPANFLLVRGSLKLIDFGIAKAIMSDTTNIQRDSQVGTLSYMSPEAFMCNETDASGNTIKCGRPSDIWSLGCILYQMVYGRTPFSEYKTFWAKFKVITDPNHEISYEPLYNPWLLDLMKKCLAWDRNQRWRIPQLLQHPFLVPPVVEPQTRSLLSPSSNFRRISLFEIIEESNEGNEKVSMLCSRLQDMVQPDASVSARELLCQISSLCSLLQEELAKT